MVSKRFAAIIITFNSIMGLLILLPNLLTLTYLASSSEPAYPLVVRNFNILTILIETYYPPGTPASQIAVQPTPYLPTYVFIFDLIINVYFIIRLLRSKE
jgi:hypothetical protein